MYKILLIAHIVFGTVALISGLVAIFTRKGSRIHKKTGSYYYQCMYGVAGSAVLMTIMHFNPFLFAIAIFAFYLTWSGKKAIEYYRIRESYMPSKGDVWPVWAGWVTGIFMIAYPFYRMYMYGDAFFPVLPVFGLIMLLNTTRDLKRLKNPQLFMPGNREWLLHHIGKMGGAFISTTTAFLLNNFHFDPVWIGWLLPTFIGVPLISISVANWKKKLKLS